MTHFILLKWKILQEKFQEVIKERLRIFKTYDNFSREKNCRDGRFLVMELEIFWKTLNSWI